MSVLLLAYLALGAVAGFLAGLFGIGGGIVMVPAYFYLFRHEGIAPGLTMHMAIATSLAAAAFTAATSTLAHHRRQGVVWPAVQGLAPGIVAGALAAGLVAQYLPDGALRAAFAVFLFYAALQLARDWRPAPHRELPGPLPLALVGTGIGALSTLLGIGGGTLTVPLLLWCNTPMIRALGTAAACGLPITLAGALSLACAGWDMPDLPVHSTGYIYWPAILPVVAVTVLTAPLGVRLAHRLPVTILRRSFAAVVALVAVRMLS